MKQKLPSLEPENPSGGPWRIGLCACGEGPITHDHIAVCRLRKPDPAAALGDIDNLIWTFKCDLRRATPGDVSEMLLTLVNADDLHKAIDLLTDLTRRLAEAEAKTACCMGVGDGSGRLFVYGDSESIRAARSLLIGYAECVKARNAAQATVAQLQKELSK